MKARVLSLLLCIAACSAAFSGTDEVEKLRGEIQNLNKQISDLQKTIELQNAEIARLKKLCIENGIDLSPKEKVEKPTQEAISQPMFGIFLGETLDSLKRRFKVVSASGTTKGVIEGTENWLVQSDNGNIKLLGVNTYQQQVLFIFVYFADASKQNYAAIKGQLEKKYKGIEEEGIPDFTFGKKFTRQTLIDGVPILIQLEHETGFMENDKLTLFYFHIPLTQKLEEENKNRKADKVKGDL